jgi:transposase
MPSQEAPPAGISVEDWAATPPSVRAWARAVEQRLARLEERLKQTSRNSSQPPSSDPPTLSRPARRPSGHRTGGQPSHPGHGRELKPEEEVDRLIEVTPTACEQCGALLLGEDPQPVRHQVTEVPPVPPLVTEYRCHTLSCLVCGAQTQASWPGDMPSGSFGPRLHAITGFLTGRMGASQREAQEILETLFGAEVSVGSIAALEQAVSRALAAPVAEATRYVQQQHMRNVDETGWREKAKRVWLWVCATPLVTVFQVLASRSAASAKGLLGEDFPGVAGTDRYSAYNWMDPLRRQLCWAHLKRDFIAFVERGGESARIGTALLAAEAQLFALWYRVRDGTLAWADFQVRMLPVMARVGSLLQEGAAGEQAHTARTCRNLGKREAALWTFVWEADVEPTNNSAERPLRRAVLWRRRSFGTQSTQGSQFVERILTPVTTLRQQHRAVLEYLTTACAAALRGDKAPSLLPQLRPVTFTS